MVSLTERRRRPSSTLYGASRRKDAGDEEAKCTLDADYIRALEYGFATNRWLRYRYRSFDDVDY